MRVTRMTTKGVKWLEINDGEIGYSLHGGKLVSINVKYLYCAETRNPNGIRWTVEDTQHGPTIMERELLDSDHVQWLAS